jgi:hypothetical protein
MRRIAIATIAALLLASGVAAAQTEPAAPEAPAAAPSAPPADASVAPPAADQAAPPAAEQAAPPAAAAAESATTSAVVGAPPAGKGQIVFFRPSKFTGGGVSFSIRQGNKGVAKLGNGTYFVLPIDPGVQEFTNHSEARDTLRLEVEPGETYYVQQTIGMGMMVGRPHLTPSDKASFEKLKLKLTTKVPSDDNEK